MTQNKTDHEGTYVAGLLRGDEQAPNEAVQHGIDKLTALIAERRVVIGNANTAKTQLTKAETRLLEIQGAATAYQDSIYALRHMVDEVVTKAPEVISKEE